MQVIFLCYDLSNHGAPDVEKLVNTYVLAVEAIELSERPERLEWRANESGH
jgi:hypothetical protein